MIPFCYHSSPGKWLSLLSFTGKEMGSEEVKPQPVGARWGWMAQRPPNSDSQSGGQLPPRAPLPHTGAATSQKSSKAVNGLGMAKKQGGCAVVPSVRIHHKGSALLKPGTASKAPMLSESFITSQWQPAPFNHTDTQTAQQFLT